MGLGGVINDYGPARARVICLAWLFNFNMHLSFLSCSLTTTNQSTHRPRRPQRRAQSSPHCCPSYWSTAPGNFQHIPRQGCRRRVKHHPGTPTTPVAHLGSRRSPSSVGRHISSLRRRNNLEQKLILPPSRPLLRRPRDAAITVATIKPPLLLPPTIPARRRGKGGPPSRGNTPRSLIMCVVKIGPRTR